MRSIVISSGHGKYVRGASGYLDEVDEARRVADRLADYLRTTGVEVKVFHDDVSTTQDENLERIVAYHDSQQRELDISVHFNAFEATLAPRGTEVWYITQDGLAEEISAAIAGASGLKDRGGKYSNDLYFLNSTDQPAILIEVCFVDSKADAELYLAKFDDICLAIASRLGGDGAIEEPDEPPPVEASGWQRDIGTTMFGGEGDPNDSAYPPYAFIDDDVLGCALPFRFSNAARPKVLVRNTANDRQVLVDIVDIGPWMIDDDYWDINMRPIAETCYEKGRPLPSGPNEGEVPTNGAGLDLTPAAAKAIELEGKGICDWRFVRS